MNDDKLNIALKNYINDTKNQMYNFDIGRCYEDIGQTTSAAAFYIRTAELNNDPLLSYEALLRLALCFEKQGSRVYLLKGILLRSISLLPTRPEAYFILSRIYENTKDWQESYTIATIGNMFRTIEYDLKTDVGYYGSYLFNYEKAVTGWWIGLFNESIELFKKLELDPVIKDNYKESIKNNLKRIL